MKKNIKIPLEEKLQLGRFRVLTCRDCEEAEALVCHRCVDKTNSRMEKIIADQRIMIAEAESVRPLLTATLEAQKALRQEIVALKERIDYLKRDNDLLRQTAHLKVTP